MIFFPKAPYVFFFFISKTIERNTCCLNIIYISLKSPNRKLSIKILVQSRNCQFSTRTKECQDFYYTVYLIKISDFCFL